jgi:hypothetical protein
MNIFGFKSKNDEVLDHWVAQAPVNSYSADEVYGAIEQLVQAHEIPGLKISRVDYTEGGALSNKRTYLRFERGLLAFDICAAPFGTGYFFSCRTVSSTPMLNIWLLLLTMLAAPTVYNNILKPIGLYYGAGGVIFALVTFAILFRQGLKAEFAFLDTALLQIPYVNLAYWYLYRRDTYFREDTRIMYMTVVPQIIQAYLDEVSAAKGVKLVRQQRRSPLFGPANQPLTPPPEIIPPATGT